MPNCRTLKVLQNNHNYVLCQQKLSLLKLLFPMYIFYKQLKQIELFQTLTSAESTNWKSNHVYWLKLTGSGLFTVIVQY
jgi:hypothetical protein